MLFKIVSKNCAGNRIVLNSGETTTVTDKSNCSSKISLLFSVKDLMVLLQKIH